MKRLHVDGTIIKSFKKSYFFLCRACWPGMPKWQDCETVEVIIFRVLLLPNYRIKYSAYIVKWYSGIACDWCVSSCIEGGNILAEQIHRSLNRNEILKYATIYDYLILLINLPTQFGVQDLPHYTQIRTIV